MASYTLQVAKMQKLFEILANGNSIPTGYGFPLVKFNAKGSPTRIATSASPSSDLDDVYFGCNPVSSDKQYGGGAKADLLFVSALGWDIDVESKRDGYPPRWLVEEALNKLSIRFGIVLESKVGGGLYPILLLSECLTTAEQHGQLELLRDAIHAELVATINEIASESVLCPEGVVYEIDRPPNIVRVLRLPGSVRKSGGCAGVVECSEQRYSVAELMSLYPNAGLFTKPVYNAEPVMNGPIASWLDEHSMASYADVLVHFGWTRSDDDWYRPGASSGARSGVEWIGQNGQVGLTCKTTGHEIFVSGHWYSRESAWVCLEFDGDWDKAAAGSRSTAAEDFAGVPIPGAVLPPATPTAKQRAALPVGGPVITNFEWVAKGNKTVMNALDMTSILSRFRAACGDWPMKVNGTLFAITEAGDVEFIANTNGLVSWIMERKPFAWESKFISKAEFYESVLRNAKEVASIEVAPHFPPLQDRYYLCESPLVGDGKELIKLLGLLRPGSDIDQELIVAMMLTVLWGGPAGERPAFLIESTAEDFDKSVGSGKTQLADIISRIGGMGRLAKLDVDISDIAYIRKAIAMDTKGCRVLLIDNAKGRAIGNAELESIITSSEVSGHVLYKGVGVKDNTYTTILNGNLAMLTKDMSQRVFIVRIDPLVSYEADAKRALLSLDYGALVNDLYAIYCRPTTKIDSSTRRPIWDEEVLSKLHNAQSIIDTCKLRSAAHDVSTDDVAMVIDTVLDNLEDQNEMLVEKMFINDEPIYIPARLLCVWLGVNRKGLKPMMRRLAIKELRVDPNTAYRGYIWCRDYHKNRFAKVNRCLKDVLPDGKNYPRNDFGD